MLNPSATRATDPGGIDMMKAIRTLLTVALLAGPLGTLQAVAAPVLLFSSPMGASGFISVPSSPAGGTVAVSALHLADVSNPGLSTILNANCLGCDANLGFSATNVDLVFTAQNAPNFANFIEALTPSAEDLLMSAAMGLPPNVFLVGISTIGPGGVGTLGGPAGFDFHVPAGFELTEIRVHVASYSLSTDGRSEDFSGSFEIFGEALAVPEPSTVLLLGLALAVLGRRPLRRAV